MKKFCLLLLAISFALGANARELSPAEALARVAAPGPKKASPRFGPIEKMPVMTVREADAPALYVFNGAAGGYIIVSANDCAAPLLGYSDSATFRPDSIPPQLQGWLDFYAQEIGYATQQQGQPRKSVSTRPERSPIAPLTQSKWNQDAPYNDDCPLDNGKRSVTGCVATAMAQVMYYHRWPEKGTGSFSYHWSVGDSTLSVNFADITFDWDDMTDTYGKESTAAQRAAVAQLMYACGVSVHMHYTSGGSGAASIDIGHALSNYFGYADDMASPQRYFYGLIDWENMIYDQLSQGLPVLYNGQGSIGGHQFICDGYSSDGYFHFNWGWSGMSDGYYLLSALDPMEQGIGGNLTGFDYEQGIWINVRPASDGSADTVVPYIYGYGNFGTTASGSVELGKEVTFEASKNFMSFTNATLKGQFGIAIESADSTIEYVAHDGTSELSMYSGPHDFTVALPTGLADGTYTVTPAFRLDSSSDWTPVRCSLSGVQALRMTVADGKASFAAYEPASIEITSVTQNTPFFFGKDFSLTVSAANPGTDEYYGEIMVALVDSNGKRVDNALMSEAIDLAGGKSTTVDIVSDFPRVVKNDTIQPGSYKLQIYEYMTGNVLYTSADDVTIAEAPATTLEMVSLNAESQTETATGKTAVTFNGTVECTKGYFTGRLQVRVYRKGATETSAKAKSEFIFVDPGSTSDFTVTVDLPDAKAGDEYYAEMYETTGEQIGNEKYYFTINDELASVDDLAAPDCISVTIETGHAAIESSAAITSAAVYSITGIKETQAIPTGQTHLDMDTSALSAGIYIITATDAAGHTTSRTIRIN